MRRISALTHLSVGLVAMTLGILSLAQLLGMVPDGLAERAKQRSQMCETLTLGLAAGAQTGDFREMDAIARGVIQRGHGLLSVGLRGHAEELIFATESHPKQWSSPAETDSRATHLSVPVLRADQAWGTAEFRFDPLNAGAGVWFLQPSILHLMAFTALAGFIAYRMYLRRMLTFLNPNRVIPAHVREAFDTLAEGVAILDPQQRIVLANSALCRAVHQTEQELEGRRLASLPWRAPASQGQEILPWEQTVRDGAPQRGHPVRLEREGGDLSFMVNVSAIQGGAQQVRGLLATFDNVTSVEQRNRELAEMVQRLEESGEQIRRQHDELQLLATRDPLTGCLNRRAFCERLDAEWRRSTRNGGILCCVMADIDRFKSVNDTHGHAAGDAVLQGVAQILRDGVRASDIVSRFGGEEFCILLPDTPLDGAAAVAEKLRTMIAHGQIAGLMVTASFGVAAGASNMKGTEALVELADRALYAAKRSGRNRVIRGDNVPSIPPPQVRGAAVESADTKDYMPLAALNGLLAALDQRDPATGAHSRRVSDLCAMLGSELLDGHECFVLEIAALLHDIGKIGLPDSILLKPGPLTPEERAFMDQHERIGIEIINSAFRSPELTNIVHFHHAFYGGKASDPGLPQGMDIPLRARILAIADAYDAMISDRPYRRARTSEQAIAELRRCAGAQFDPRLVERFIDVLAARGGQRKLPSNAPKLDVAFQLGVQAERIAALLETRDVEQFKIVSQRLAMLAEKSGLTRISERAADLHRQLTSEFDVEALQLLRRLLDECRAVQDELLNSAVGPAPRGQPVPLMAGVRSLEGSDHGDSTAA